MAFVSIVCGADSWEEIGVMVAARAAWWIRVLGLKPQRVPDVSCFKRVLPAIKTTAFMECYEAFSRELSRVLGAQLCLDGKALRGSDTYGDSPLKMVHVWSADQRLLVAQQCVEDGNELGGMIAVIQRLELQGARVSVDAGGASKPLAQAILTAGAQYAITIKANQRNLLEGMADRFLEVSRGGVDPSIAKLESATRKHGRRETRIQWATSADSVPEAATWPGAKSCLLQCQIREIKGRRTACWRYTISSEPIDSPSLHNLIRTHWDIENRLHWILDVSFAEDDSRMRRKNSQLNFATLRRFALTLLTQVPAPKKRISVKGRRLFASLNEEFLLRVLLGKPPETTAI
jgi:predicted transposase YbfD/YdcC